MLLSDADVERYARQIIVPGVGAAGQAKLLASRVWIVGHTGGVGEASAYMRAAGVRVSAAWLEGQPPDCVLVAGADHLSQSEHEILSRTPDLPMLWYRVRNGTIQSGCGKPEPAPDLPQMCGSADTTAVPDDVLHALGACDLAASALGLLVGWPSPAGVREVRFG